MKVGEYVRTPQGIIAKIISIQDEVGQYFINGNAVSLESKNYIADKNITIGENFKHSQNIIDLIEIGDYVNGYKILGIEKSDIVDKDGNLIKEKIKLLIGRDMYGLSEYIEEKDIKSIVTKEQFESMEYKVED